MPVILSAEYLLGPRCLQGVEPAVKILVVCGDNAGVSDDHATLCQKPPKTAKVLSWDFVPPKRLILGGAGQGARNRPLMSKAIQNRTFWAIPSAAKRCGAGQDGFDPLKVDDLCPNIGQMDLSLVPDFGA